MWKEKLCRLGNLKCLYFVSENQAQLEGWGISNVSYFVSESQAQLMLYAHWVMKEMAGQKQALSRSQELKAPTPALYIQYTNSAPQRKTFFLLYVGSIKLTFFSPYLKLGIFHISFSCLPQPFLLPYTDLNEGYGNKMVYESVAHNTALSISLVRKKKSRNWAWRLLYSFYHLWGTKSEMHIMTPEIMISGSFKNLSCKGLSSENMTHFYSRQ